MEEQDIQAQDLLSQYRPTNPTPLTNEIPKEALNTTLTSIQKEAKIGKESPSQALLDYTNSSDAVFSPFVDNKIKTKDYIINQSEVYKELNSGELTAMYPTYIQGTDNNERLAQNQSGWEQTINGLTKAQANIGNVILGNTAGFVYGLTDWARTGNFSSVYDNSFSKTLDDWNTKLNYQLPNYYTKDQQDSTIFGKALTANFWANDVMNGVSFTVGTVASEAIWAYATGGLSLGARAGQLGAKISNFGKFTLGAEKTAEGLAKYKGFVYQALDNAVASGKLTNNTANAFAKTGEVLNTARFIATSSGNEAGIEAFHFKKEAMENFYSTFEQTHGRQPNAEEIADITDKIEGASNSVFAGNMAILGISNLAMIGNMFNAKLPLGNIQANINKKLFGVGIEKTAEGVFKGIERKAWQKGAGLLYKTTTPVIREGLFEEGLQGVATKTANNWIERQYDPKYLNKVSNIYEDAWKAMGEQYGTKEGWTEIGIGGIVGILGGTVTGEFSQFSKLSEEQSKVVAPSMNAMNVTMNTLVSDVNAKRYSAVAKIMASEDRAEQAKMAGDAVASKLAHNESMIATLEMHNDPIFNTDFDQLINHFNNTIDTTEVSEEEKDTIKDGFKTLVKEYKSADNFADSIVGSQGRIYGTNFQAKEVKKALTYSILQGQTAKGMMDSSLEEMQSYMNSELVNSVKRSEELEALGKDKKRQVKNLSQQFRNLEKKSLSVQKAVQILQATPNEAEGDKQSRLVEMQQRLLEIEDSKTTIRAELEGIGKEMAQSKKMQQSFGQDVSTIPMVDEFISVDELINLDDKLKELESNFTTLKEVNPISAKALKENMDNYQKAKSALINHNEVIKAISQGKFKPTIANDNPFSSLFNKFSKSDSKPEEFTGDFLTKLNEIRKKGNVEYVQTLQEKDVEKATKTLEELAQLETLTEEQQAEKLKAEKIISDLTTPITEEVKDDTPQKKEVVAEKELSPVEALKARIEDILKLFKSDFVGTYNAEEASKTKPSQKDIERYRDLQGTDSEEFQTLKSKLSQWRVYDSLAEDNESIADLLDVVIQLETEVEQQSTLVEPNIEDTFGNEVNLKPSESVDIYELSINTNFPVTVKRETKGNYIITHLNPSSLLEKMGATEVTINKKPVSFEDVNIHKKAGVVVKFMSGGVAREFTIEDRGRININGEDFNAIPNVRTIQSLSSWTYPNLYEQDFEGNWKPISSDFSDPNITGDSNNLKEDDALELYVDVENEYNQKLLKQKLSSEELANQVVIYIRKGGENYGTIKGLPNRENIKGTEMSVITLRDLAGKSLSEGFSEVIGHTKVKYVQLGNPILNIDGSGTISQIAISDMGLKNVVATGFVQDGEITLNSSVKPEDVRRTFIKKITEKNKGSKVPLIIIKRGAQLIAFPIKLNKTTVSKVEELDVVLNDNTKTDAQKVTAINEVLIKNGIAPKDFNLTNLDEQKVNAIADRLENNQEFITADQLAEKGYKKENLKNDATIALDLENLSVSLPSQKFNIDLENISYEDLPTLKVEKQEVLEKEAKKEVETPKVISAKKQVNKPKTSLIKEETVEDVKTADVEEVAQTIVDKIKEEILKAEPTVFTEEKPTPKEKETLLSFEGVDWNGDKATFYKKNNKWGYLNSDNIFEPFIERAQAQIETEYQVQKELNKANKDEKC